MNDIIAILYDRLFDWNTYQELSGMVFDNLDYGKLGWLILIIPILILIIFYKLWDPVSNSKLKWWLIFISIGIIAYICASTVLYNNPEVLQYLGDYTGENGQPDADYFIVQMSTITLVYCLIIAFILSIVPFRLISTNNRNNPF